MNLLIHTQKTTWEGFTVGGAETSLQLIAEQLAARGHNITYLTETERGRLPRYRRYRKNGVEVHAIAAPDLPSKGFGPLLRARSALADWYFDRAVERIVRRNRIDLVYTYHELPSHYRILKLRERKKLSFKTVQRIGGLWWTNLLKQDPSLASKLEYVFRHADLLNPNTPGMIPLFEQAIEEFGLKVPKREYAVQDIGVDLSRFPGVWTGGTGSKPSASSGKSASTTAATVSNPRQQIVMASRLSTHQKRQDLLVEAMAHLPEGHNVELLLIGEGPEREKLEHRAKELGLDNRVRFVPYMDQSGLWRVLCECELYTHACDFEGLSSVLIEAMAMGVPVLASDVVPLNDYIRDGENGFLVANRPEAWASRIEELLKDRNGRARVSETARSSIQERFSADQGAAAYETLFEGLLGSPDGGNTSDK
ncbi:MAG: glycosyltransferase family 4 protein [Balneolaceae bacterium]